MYPLIGFLRVCTLLLEDTRRIYIIIVLNSPIPLDFRRANSHRTKASNGYCLAVWQFPNNGSSIFTILISLFFPLWSSAYLSLSLSPLEETKTNRSSNRDRQYPRIMVVFVITPAVHCGSASFEVKEELKAVQISLSVIDKA